MDSASRPFRQNRPLQLMVVWLLGFWLLTAITPFDRLDWFLENLLVFVYSILLIATYRRFTFSNLSYALFTLFMTLHLVGAHYTYAETPLGYWLMEWFGWQRNHYDRIVHFAFGFLLAYPFYEVLRRAAGLRPGWAQFLVINAILAFSGFFEILEAMIAMLVSPDLGDAYLGTQGDIWDAQKDMGLAFVGAVITMGITALVERMKNNKRLTPT